MSFFDKIAGVIKSPVQALGNLVGVAGNGLKALWHIGTFQWSKVGDDIGNMGKEAIKCGLNIGQTALAGAAILTAPTGIGAAGFAAGAFALECVEQSVGGGKQNLWGNTDPKAW